jgi:hypothetical protein
MSEHTERPLDKAALKRAISAALDEDTPERYDLAWLRVFKELNLSTKELAVMKIGFRAAHFYGVYRGRS